MADDSNGDDDSGPIPNHIGKETGFANSTTKKKDHRLQKAEKNILNLDNLGKVPYMLGQNVTRQAVMEGLMSNGYFTECATLDNHRNGMCGNCLASGEGVKNCSFLANLSPTKKRKAPKQLGPGLNKRIQKLDTRKALYKTQHLLFGLLADTAQNLANMEASDEEASDSG
ncbi:MAG: hypothetical protein Q9169_006134 [Polycauliona sp. 2 TL-2023]